MLSLVPVGTSCAWPGNPSTFQPTLLLTQGLAIFGFLTYVLYRLNAVVRAQVALKQDRRAGRQQKRAGAGAGGGCAGTRAAGELIAGFVPP